MTFEAYLEQYYAKWADSKFKPKMKFEDLFRTYFAVCQCARCRIGTSHRKEDDSKTLLFWFRRAG
jgi:hypothetical protein